MNVASDVPVGRSALSSPVRRDRDNDPPPGFSLFTDAGIALPPAIGPSAFTDVGIALPPPRQVRRS